MVIAVTGKKRSGKNTLTSYLRNKYNFIEYAFAQPIKKLSYDLFDWNPEEDEDLKECVDPRWGISRRQFWQWFGTDAMQLALGEYYADYKKITGRNVWVKIFENFYEKNKDKNICISDFRFPHEEAYLRSINAVTVKLIRKAPDNKMDMHESEMHIDSLITDVTIYNDSNVESLYTKVDNFMDILGGTQCI